MPGNRAKAIRGLAHQIWRQRKITASAPPMSRPSLVRTRISSNGAPGSRPSRCMTQVVCSGRKRNPRRRNIRSNRLAEAAQDRQSPSYKIQPRNESAEGAALSLRAVNFTEPAAESPRRSIASFSLTSVISVNSEFMSQKFASSFCTTQQSQRFVTHLGQLEQGRGWQFFQLEIGGFS